MAFPSSAGGCRPVWLGLSIVLAVGGCFGGGDEGSGDGAAAGSGGAGGGGRPDETPPQFDPIDTDEPWHSGPRLRAKVVDGGDGALLFDGWFDTELEADCAFQIEDDGLARCLPLSGMLELGVIGYLDADCSIGVSITQAEPDSVVWTDGALGGRARCGPTDFFQPPTFYRVAETIEHLDMLYMDLGDTCEPGFGVPDIPVATLEPVGRSEFVAAQVGRADDTVGALWFAAQDGSFETATLLTADGAECDLLDTPNLSPRCMGLDVTEVIGTDVSDAASCDAYVMVREQTGPCGDGPLVVAPETPCNGMRGGYGRPSEFLSATWKTGGPLFAFDFSTQTCNAANFGAFEYLAPSAASPEPSLLPPEVELAERGTGQLRARFGRSSAGRLARNPTPRKVDEHTPRYFYDTHNELYCQPHPARLTPSGEEDFRCLPIAIDEGRWETAYMDPDCKEPALIAYRGSCPTAPDAELFGLLSKNVPAEEPDYPDVLFTHVLRARPGSMLQDHYYYLAGNPTQPTCEAAPPGDGGARIVEKIPIDEFAPIRWNIE